MQIFGNKDLERNKSFNIHAELNIRVHLSVERAIGID